MNSEAGWTVNSEKRHLHRILNRLESGFGLPPRREVVVFRQLFLACGFLCIWVSGYGAFVLWLSVSIVLDSHDSSVAVSFRFEVLSPAPGGRMSKLQEFLLKTV